MLSSERAVHPSSLAAFEKSVEYYQKSVARYAVLNNVLPTPSKVMLVFVIAVAIGIGIISSLV